jgi:hypothetical protein
MNIDPLLAAADVLVTCVSSVAFEFLVLGKPVIYIDTPEFFSRGLKLYFPHENTEDWAVRTGVNAGREFGTLVKKLDELIPAVETALTRKASPDIAEEMQRRFLYNPGKATENFVDILNMLYIEHGGGRKPLRKPRHTRITTAAAHYAKGAIRRFRRAWNVFWRDADKIKANPKPKEKRIYFDVASTVDAARKAGLSIADYLESQDDSPKKIGRRDRIISSMGKHGLLDITGRRVVEIGAGTGRFLEKTIVNRPACYDVYELDKNWSRYLKDTYGNTPGVDLRVHEADGKSLNKTPNASCDCIYAHGIFVYTPFTITIGYLRKYRVYVFQAATPVLIFVTILIGICLQPAPGRRMVWIVLSCSRAA